MTERHGGWGFFMRFAFLGRFWWTEENPPNLPSFAIASTPWPAWKLQRPAPSFVTMKGSSYFGGSCWNFCTERLRKDILLACQGAVPLQPERQAPSLKFHRS